MSFIKLSNTDVIELAAKLSRRIWCLNTSYRKVYGIPRGGIPAAYAVTQVFLSQLQIVNHPEEADIFIDDIIDSGETMQKYCDEYPGKPFFALIDKVSDPELYKGQFVVFPWEDTAESSIEENIKRLLQFVGEDTERGGLQETPTRVAKAWQHWCSGYGQDAGKVLKVFDDGAEHYDEMVIVKDIPLYSHCEHHLAAIFGTVTVAYIPNGKIVGLSKIPRLVNVFARRLQVQERLTTQIAQAINEHLKPKGVGVTIKARHKCMESRGICQQGHHTITNALLGVFKEKPETRAEFMNLSK